jgi:hypothetical protein
LLDVVLCGRESRFVRNATLNRIAANTRHGTERRGLLRWRQCDGKKRFVGA